MQYRLVATDAFSSQRQHIWDLCYRVTGSAADADLLLRDCFSRAVACPPLIGLDPDWRAHLARSAAVLAMERLRQRKRRNYVGAWLPSPVDTGNAVSRGPRPGDALSRYDMVESGSIAFLRALEALDPRERAMLVLCDAFGMTSPDAAATLDLTTWAAKSALQGARRKMQPYDATHLAPSADIQAQSAGVLHEVLRDLQHHDTARLEKLLALDAEAWFDSGGEFVAPLAPIAGAANVARLLVKFSEGIGPIRFAFRMLNGLPAALGVTDGRSRWAHRLVVRLELREGLLVSQVHVIMAGAKLTAVRFNPA